MARPVKWSRDLYSIRERAANARTETWGAWTSNDSSASSAPPPKA
ncbi:hypothetical protein ACPOL_0871 [Acidisarcina polymorpha]|uniref:Uncharacterized protein n=1 Tax=Acidisarcina polymorpha TaxID=2211140 RepID=A0A2Z5FTR5_9BACT|nr:hypothetical protein ACPOL_0871 [Acidisarcina polymorpha]